MAIPHQLKYAFYGAMILIYGTNGYLYPSIHWTSTNPLFKRNRTQCMYPESILYFLCPNTVTVVANTQDSFLSPEYENLWLVGEESYERCNVTQGVDRKLQVCNKPFELKSYRVIFREYGAGNLPVFQPGEDYYFIATSDGTASSVDQTGGGHCKTHNMKLKFHICVNSNDPLCLNEDLCNGIVPSQKSTTAATTTTTTTTAQQQQQHNNSNTTTPTKTANVSAQRRKPATSHSLETASSTISTIYTTPTTIMPDDNGNERNLETNETMYHTVIGILVICCVLLSCVCVMFLCKFKRTQKTSSSSSSNSSAERNSGDASCNSENCPLKSDQRINI
ncbi:ephrin-B2-like [Acropora millepora]|uniref:ephrin-B2-like n=1 Tax=Acropora millepora TaxID=45264 RepID=UPI001CF3DCF6|nr:ephrin-B2-like [Acropora millepora]